jgi:hypothetical protein
VNSRAMRISKSKYIAGVQCLKRLYLQVHEPGLAAKPDDPLKRYCKGPRVVRKNNWLIVESRLVSLLELLNGFPRFRHQLRQCSRLSNPQPNLVRQASLTVRFEVTRLSR